MKLLVTGGAGFIGSNFIHYMLDKHPDIEILNYDKLTYAGNLDNLRAAEGKPYICDTTPWDICDYLSLKTTLEAYQPDAVVAFAAESHVDNSLERPQVFLETNILGTEVILRCVKELGIKKLVHISTDEVYGSLREGEATENSAFKTNSPYSASKASGDLLCRAYHTSYGVPVVVMRGSNCYGPRQHPEKLIPKSITNLLSDKPVCIYGEGLNVREWIHVSDFCSGVETALLSGIPGEAYNLGGGSSNRVQNINIAKTLTKEFGKPGAIEYVTDRLGHDFRYALNSSKLKSLGWEPQYDFDEGLIKTVDWYKENTWWWKTK